MEWRRQRPLLTSYVTVSLSALVSVRWSCGSRVAGRPGVLRAAQLPVLTVQRGAPVDRREVVFCTRCLMVIFYH